ncbi:MAG: four helix bundle protein [Bacteroidetes bacterium]|nr:four helix bundle protein [Bacteroidota bacterium]
MDEIKNQNSVKENLVKDKSFEFALIAIKLYKKLLERNEYVLSKQFLRAATSIGANVEEALAGYSKKDFAAKMSIASKEARETMYWIKLIEFGNFVEYDFTLIKEESARLIRILTSIVKTTQTSLKK